MTTKELASCILKYAIDKDTKGYMAKGLNESRVLKPEEHKIEKAENVVAIGLKEPIAIGPEEPMAVGTEEEKSQKLPVVPGWEREDGVE